MHLRLSKCFVLLCALSALSGCCIYGGETRYADEWRPITTGNDNFDNNVVNHAVIANALEACRIQTYQTYLKAIFQECEAINPSVPTASKEKIAFCSGQYQQLKTVDINELSKTEKYYLGFANILDSAAFKNEKNQCMSNSGYVLKRVSQGMSCNSMRFF